MVVQYPGSHNVFVPDHEASGKMTVDFSRNEKDFAINSYCQIQPVKLPIGYYRFVTVEEAGRIINPDLSQFAWADGMPRPEGWDGTESFDWRQFRTERYAFPVMLGDLTVDNASWDIRAEYAAKKAQQAMTGRTQLAISQLTNPANYDPTHTSVVASIPGNSGPWSASTTARTDIKRSLDVAAQQILQDTLAAVNLNELMIVMSPGCARLVALSQEIVDHIKGSPDALAQIKGELPGRNAIFGLPDKIYGYPVIIEKTVRVTTRKGAAVTNRAFVLGDQTPFMCSRPGGLVGVFGAPSFSTMVIFMLEEMTVETIRDTNNRRTSLSVVENYSTNLVAPVSGYLFQQAV
jgi:hypothetical protein